MKFPLSWLKEFIPTALSPQKIAEALTLLGLEVDKVEENPRPFQGVLVARVVDVQPHPQAQKLVLATIFDGKKELTLVCGAPNCRIGMKTAFAPLGAQLTDENGHSFLIKKAVLRGVESEGCFVLMMNSAFRCQLLEWKTGFWNFPMNS